MTSPATWAWVSPRLRRAARTRSPTVEGEGAGPLGCSMKGTLMDADHLSGGSVRVLQFDQ
jgi:hypothetical protein